MDVFVSFGTILIISLLHPTATGTKIRIYDNVLTESNLEELTSFVSDVLTWKQRSIFAREKELSGKKTFWHSSSYQDVKFSELNSWKSLKQLVIHQHDNTRRFENSWPFNVQGNVLLRGDFPQIQEMDNSSLCNLFIFICTDWKKNFYGEILFFGMSGKYRESVHPRNGRVVVVPPGLSYTVKPPSMNTEKRLVVISLSATSNDKSLLVSQPHPEYNDISLTLTPRENSWQISQHITKEFQVDDDKKIIVFDDVFTPDELKQFLEKIDQGIYHYNPPSHDSEDNVMWILGLDVSNLMQSGLWTILNEAFVVATGSRNYFPYDVSCNNIQTWHHPKIHRDCLDYENDFTLLVYLMPNWNDSYYGETVFYDHDDEIVVVVRPGFGRIVVFHGAIRHSARPPSPMFKGPRYTFAVKCAPTKEKAMRKFLILSFESLFSFDEHLVGPEKAAEIHKFTTRLEDGEGEHEEMQKLGSKYERELEELEKQHSL